jgi:hypothetical protein
MQPAGLASFEKRTESKSKIYSYEKEEVELTPNFKKQFKANKKAGTTFSHWHLHIKRYHTLGNERKARDDPDKKIKSTYFRQCSRNEPMER